jgi:hypothetical protein
MAEGGTEAEVVVAEAPVAVEGLVEVQHRLPLETSVIV